MDSRTRKTIRLLLIAAGVTLVLAGCALRIPPKKFDMNQVIQDIEKKAYFVQRFRAEFVKTRHTSVFDRDLSASGTLIFEKPNSFRLVTKGDVNVEIVSDGNVVSLIHDRKDQEIRRIYGERDWASFADPLIVILQNLSNGALRKFSTQKTRQEDKGFVVLLRPSEVTSLERIDKALLTFSPAGVIKEVTIHFKNGDWDQTLFRSWAMVTEDDPDILTLEKRLKEIRSLITLRKPQLPQPAASSAPPVPPSLAPAHLAAAAAPPLPGLSLAKQASTTIDRPSAGPLPSTEPESARSID
jgi:outer membrane lipoprotein-sorting protein